MVKSDDDELGSCYELSDERVKRAIGLINCSSEVSLEKKVGLELAYIIIPGKYLNLEEHPETYVSFIQTIYECMNSSKATSALCMEEHYIFYLLTNIKRIPGQDKNDEIEQYKVLAKWVSKVRGSCHTSECLRIADYCLGQLFSHAPVGKDGVWPN